LKKKEEKQIVEDFESEIKKGGLVVSGIRNTIRSLNKGEVKTLLVTRKFSKPGRLCPKCRLLYLDETECPACKVKTIPVIDIIDRDFHQASWFLRPLIFPSESNQLIPRLALFFEEPCPLASG